MLELKNVNKTYKMRKGIDNKVLKNISLKFDSVGMTFILGKSGSGKSTLLNIIGGLDKYDSGDISIFGKSTKNFKEKEFDSYRNNYIGFVFQEFNVIEDYTVYENIVLALELQNKKIKQQEIEKLLTELEMNDLKHRKINELSGGQKQRVAIARALIKDPKFILADEPTGNLDSETGKQVLNVLKEISKDKLVIVVSHNEEQATKYGDRVIEIKDGEVAGDTNIISNTKTSDTYRYKKAKLPFKDALKLGFFSLKKRKLKLFITMILITFSSLFLIVTYTTKTYNVEENHLRLYKEKKLNTVEIKKHAFIKDYDNQITQTPRSLKTQDIDEITKHLEKDTYPVYSLRDEGNAVNFFKLDVYQQTDLFYGKPEPEKDLYTNIPSDIQIIESDFNKTLISEKIIGRIAQENNEIVISNYLADMIIQNGIYEYSTNQVYKPKTIEELVQSNKLFSFGSYNSAKVVGVIDYDLKAYEPLKGFHGSKEKSSRTVLYTWRELRKKTENTYNKVYVKKGFITALKEPKNINLERLNFYVAKLDGKKDFYQNNGIIDHEIEYFDGTTWKKANKLKENEMIINIQDIISDYELYNSQLSKYISDHSEKSKLELEKEFLLHSVNLNEYIGKTIELDIYNDEVFYSQILKKQPTKKINSIKIIGISGLSSSNSTESLFGEDGLKDYIDTYKKTDSILMIEDNIDNVRELQQLFPFNTKYSLDTFYSGDILTYKNDINRFDNIVDPATIVFLIFSIVLIGNFMYSSISSRKKDIGILRSLGAKSTDIMKIFLVEEILLALITTVLSSIVFAFMFKFLNNTLMETANISISPFYLDTKLIGIIFIYILIVILVSSILPLRKIIKMKPIDAIYNRK